MTKRPMRNINYHEDALSYFLIDKNIINRTSERSRIRDSFESSSTSRETLDNNLNEKNLSSKLTRRLFENYNNNRIEIFDKLAALIENEIKNIFEKIFFEKKFTITNS